MTGDGGKKGKLEGEGGTRERLRESERERWGCVARRWCVTCLSVGEQGRVLEHVCGLWAGVRGGGHGRREPAAGDGVVDLAGAPRDGDDARRSAAWLLGRRRSGALGGAGHGRAQRPRPPQ
eukprot:451224-Rhodomonas_salina.1